MCLSWRLRGSDRKGARAAKQPPHAATAKQAVSAAIEKTTSSKDSPLTVEFDVRSTTIDVAVVLLDADVLLCPHLRGTAVVGFGDSDVLLLGIAGVGALFVVAVLGMICPSSALHRDPLVGFDLSRR